MLIDEYLSVYDIQEVHSISLNGSSSVIYEKMLHSGVRSPLINFLFRLRGMPKEIGTIKELTRLGFIKLGENPGSEILFGMVTNSPIFNCCYSDMTPAGFLQKSDASIIKAVINFSVRDSGNMNSVISTETRVWCGDKNIRSKFMLYWFFVKPFSQLVRRSMLRTIKKKILQSESH